MADVLTPSEIEDRVRAAGLTIKALCERAEIAESTFARWKRGAHHVNTETYKKIMAVVRNAEAAQEQAYPPNANLAYGTGKR